MTAFNHRGEKKKFRQDYFPWDKPPSRQEHLDCLRPANFFLMSVWFLPSPGFSAYLRSYFPPSQLISRFRPRSNLENVWAGTWMQNSGERFPCVISSKFDCQISMRRGSAHQPAWRMAPRWCALFPKCGADSGSRGTWWLAGGGVTLLILPLGLMSANSNLTQPQHFQTQTNAKFWKNQINKQKAFTNS